MKGVNTLLGWLLMLAVLAVPSFLFYNWWSKNKAPVAVETAADAPAGEVFPSAEKSSGTQPSAMPGAASQHELAVSTSPAAARGTVPGAPAPQFKPGPAPERDAPAALAQPSANAPEAAAPAPAQPAPASAQTAQPAVSASTQPAKISFYSPKGKRNPMLSPQDYAKIKEVEAEREEAARLARMNQTRKVRDTGIEGKIQLQGIVGNAAIINGDMCTVGQTKYGGKLVKVGADYIIMEYKGKTFRKNMR